MLSQQFETIVKNLYQSIELSKDYDKKRNDSKERWGLELSFKTMLQHLKEINNVLIGDDSGIYTNSVNNGILHDINGLSLNTIGMYVPDIKRLDYFDQTNQERIASLLNVFDKNYRLNNDFYKKLDYNNLSVYEKRLLTIYISVLFQHVHFVWKSSINTYMADFIEFGKILLDYGIKLTPFDCYNVIIAHFANFLFNKDNASGIEKINKLLEKYVDKYKNINIFTLFNEHIPKIDKLIEIPVKKIKHLPVQNVVNKKPKPVKKKCKFTISQLSLLRVDGLKDLCKKSNIKINSKMKRVDLENVLLNFS
jgi:hypothetical protein